MAGRVVVWTKTADLQFRIVLEYWISRNKSTRFARKLIDQVSERTKQIANDPWLYREMDELDVHVSTLVNYSITKLIPQK